ncbi:MAG TPA: hypothetical protein VLN45_05680 [Ignavibacteriaceae bacterium]|nr:hypothetical protein [Ignavibacteriaceae bacterium]
MKFFPSIADEEKKIFFIPLFFFLIIFFAEVTAILILNSGLIVYTVDDSYIHLALAENILRGHYGVNLNEYSSPSSSILWPFILAPFSGFSFGYLAPLIINSLSATGIVLVFFLVIKQLFLNDHSRNSKLNTAAILFLILLIPATNLIGTLFSGMEHTFQIFFTILIIWGLINLIQKKYLSNWLIAALIIAPLIRYENLALSFAALIFLYFTGYKKKAIIVFFLITALSVSFSIFLLNLGLEALPLSIINKSDVVSSGSLNSLINNLKNNILNVRSILLFGIMILLIISSLKKIDKEERLVAGCIVLAILLHLLAGKSGRYMVYTWTAAILSLLFLYRDWLKKIIIKTSFLKTAVIFVLLTIIISYYYIFGVITLPIGSNNIYEQQYQMHRFIVEYYKKPVAVNDLGYVSYQNDHYVLDLVGLASPEALNHWRANDKSDWIDSLSRKHNVSFAMIYDNWFERIPESWFKVAELYLGKKKLAPAENVVSFYILNTELKTEVIPLLKSFSKTLPNGVKLKIF